MNHDDRQMIADLFERMRSVQNLDKDGDAEAFIHQSMRENGDSPYLLVQSVLAQEVALQEAASASRNWKPGWPAASRRALQVAARVPGLAAPRRLCRPARRAMGITIERRCSRRRGVGFTAEWRDWHGERRAVRRRGAVVECAIGGRCQRRAATWRQWRGQPCRSGG